MPRLLISIEVLDFISHPPRRKRDVLDRRFREIAAFPANHSDYRFTDPHGRLVDVSVVAGLAITYWNDGADDHLKILEIEPAD